MPPDDAKRQLANFEWYASVSRRQGLPPRCPFASVRRCPKYFHSLTSLADASVISDLDPAVRSHLEEKWSEDRPAVAEDSPGWMKAGDDNVLRQVFGICPEVGFDVFGRFASYFHTYPDDIDRDLGYRQLNRSGADRDDPRWTWASVIAEHYTECRHYSVLLGATIKSGTAAMEVHVKDSPQAHVTIKGTDASTSTLKPGRPSRRD